MELNMTAEEVWPKFRKVQAKLNAFNDSGKVPAGYTNTELLNSKMKVEDCLKAIEKAKQLGWYNHTTFDSKEYHRLNQLSEGDLNWIVPKRLVATSSPAINMAEGLPPQFYIPYFRENNITAVIRLNEALYVDLDFEKHGIRVYPMEFTDGANPQEALVAEFIRILENESDNRRGAVVVHCKAGLGRTGTMIACYLMYKHGFTAREATAWIRICRPGSIVGAQQLFV